MMTLRPIEEGDLKQIYEWRNHPETRKYMVNSKPIVWEEHLAYWNKRMTEGLCFIIMDSETPVGVVKVDKRGNDYDTGVFIGYEMRGKGYGTAGLSMVKEKAKEQGIKKLSTMIVPENPASEKSFGKVGFIKIWSKYEVVL